ncbi:MAG: serine/threonine protein kinase [Planctomycetes bacterium]|nr:serine/threonine protein kinase [Planctomycetota bacterium]
MIIDQLDSWTDLALSAAGSSGALPTPHRQDYLAREGRESLSPLPNRPNQKDLQDPRSMVDDIPRLLGGKWRILAWQGEGRFGNFYLGCHAVLGMRVGIKILKQEFTSTDVGRRLFHQEAMRVSLFGHPNIVKVIDYGEEEGLPYLVMEYLTGKPLHRCLMESECTLEEGIEVVRQSAIGLIAAHQGVGVGEPLVHLDLKPEHIFVEKIQGAWHVKIIDFGIADIVSAPGGLEGDPDGQGARKRIAGTFSYMAPERWRGVADPRCDLYSLGVILYELVSSRKPFEAANPLTLRRLQEDASPVPPSRFRPGRSNTHFRELDSIILRALEKDPGRRFQSAEELVRALGQWQSRPRRSLGQRILRAALPPALVALLAAALLYWSPWEAVHLISVPPAIGPEGAVEIAAAVPGPGYEGGRAWLRVRSGDDRYGDVRLGTVDSRRMVQDTYPGWRDIAGALPSRNWQGGEEIEAMVWVQGWAFRSVTSGWFRIRFDNCKPRILEINGDREASAGRFLRVLKGEKPPPLHIVADKLLDLKRCQLDGLLGRSSPESTVERSAMVVFSIPLNAREIAVKLFDLAGNHQDKKWSIAWVQDPAQAPEIDFDLATEEGSERQPLHHPDCPTRRSREGPKLLRFKYGIKKAFHQQLPELLVHNPDTGFALKIEPQEGEFPVDEGVLIPFLKPETLHLELFLVVKDAWQQVLGQSSCRVHFEAKPDMIVIPESGQQPGRSDHVEVEVIPAGPEVAKVLIQDRPAAGGGKRYSAGIDVKPAGITPVPVRVVFKNGCVIESTLKYWFQPINGEKYLFDFGGEVGKLWLMFHQAKDVPPFYSTLVQDSEEIRERFLERDRGREFPDAGKGPGTTYKEAIEIAQWLGRNLGLEIRLPTPPEWSSLWRAGLLFEDGAEPVREWLSILDQPEGAMMRVSRKALAAPFVKPTGDPGAIRWGHEDHDHHRCFFRLVIRPPEDSSICPKKALDSKPFKKKG